MKNLILLILTASLLFGTVTFDLGESMNNRPSDNENEQSYTSIGALGVWHRPGSSGRETTLDGICAVLDEMAGAGINMVFLETFYHGMTVYKTTLVPYYSGFDAYSYGDYPDYLTAFTAEAKKRGIEVHAWVESFYLGVNEDTPLVKYFPDWLLLNEQGSIRHTTEGASLGGYIFFDPANRDAREYLVRFYDDLLTRVPDLSGLNLDYIRYPVSSFSGGTDSGYTTAAMSEFAEIYGLSLSEINTRADFKAQISAASLTDEWTRYRADRVTDFVREVSEMVNEKHRDTIISVAVHPDVANAYSQKKQDFTAWVDCGYVDVVTPMVYHYTAAQIKYSLNEMLARFDGVYCYSGLYTTYHNQSTDELAAHIGASNDCGADGFVLFESVKTFFTPSYDYASALAADYGRINGLAALPHWSTERLITASAEIISATLAKNGECADSIATLTTELDRIAQYGEGSVAALEKTITELSALRISGISPDLSEPSRKEVTEVLDRLSRCLEIRKERLDKKGYPDAGPTDDPTDPTPDDNPTNTPDEDDTPKRQTFLDRIKAFFERIANWFRDLFKKRN